MKYLHFLKYMFAFALLINGTSSHAQSEMIDGLGFTIVKSYKKGIKKENLKDMKSLQDLKEGFPTSWISAYKSVFVSAVIDGHLKILESQNEILTAEQIDMIQHADYWSDISVDVTYIPMSNMLLTSEKNINFIISVLPEKDASFTGGEEQMKAYLKAKTFDKISEADRKALLSTEVKFVVDKTGKITYAEISERSENEELDKLLLNAIYTMPKWEPATKSDGTTLEQDFVFMIGREIGC